VSGTFTVYGRAIASLSSRRPPHQHRGRLLLHPVPSSWCGCDGGL